MYVYLCVYLCIYRCIYLGIYLLLYLCVYAIVYAFIFVLFIYGPKLHFWLVPVNQSRKLKFIFEILYFQPVF